MVDELHRTDASTFQNSLRKRVRLVFLCRQAFLSDTRSYVVKSQIDRGSFKIQLRDL